MTDSTYTYIGILIDRSGSMRGSENDVVGGINAFLKDQRQLPGRADITIARFDQEYETIISHHDLKTMRDITHADITPRGNTALADALSRMTVSIGAHLAALPEEARPGNVCVLVFSDGEENSSRETTMVSVRELVKEQQEKYNWKYLFFGMDMNAAAAASKLGMKGLNVSKSALLGGTRAASAYVGSSRLGYASEAEAILSSHAVTDTAAQNALRSYESKSRAVRSKDDEEA